MKTTIKLTLLLLFTVLHITCNRGQSSKSTEISGKVSVIAPEAYQERSMNQTIVDVRKPVEYNSGHIEGAINIDFFSPDFLDQIAKLDKNEPIFIYCRSGKRSAKASSKMLEIGFEEVLDLKCGIINWTKSNQKLVK
jgi:rhodanese-related sulfurtransferase